MQIEDLEETVVNDVEGLEEDEDESGGYKTNKDKNV